MSAPQGYRENAQGHLVPVSSISPLDHERDRLVRDIFCEHQELAEANRAFRDKAVAQILAFQELSAGQYGVQPRKRAGGDVTLNSFDGSLRVVMANDDQLAFNEQLSVAKQMIFECIDGWTADASAPVRALVQAAFRATRKGQLSMSRILALRSVEIADDKWQLAMKALGDALQVIGSRTYVRVYKRVKDDRYVLLPLDGCGPEHGERSSEIGGENPAKAEQQAPSVGDYNEEDARHE